jgi:hypothetical protein
MPRGPIADICVTYSPDLAHVGAILGMRVRHQLDAGWHFDARRVAARLFACQSEGPRLKFWYLRPILLSASPRTSGPPGFLA